MSDPWAFIAEALVDHPLVTVEDLQAEVDAGAATLWTGERSAVFTRITGSVCECAPAGGDLAEILGPGREAIEAWAQERGCTQILIQAGRDGWARALAPYGYEQVAVVLRKTLRWV